MPTDPSRWGLGGRVAVTTREVLIAQLRGQREATRLAIAELRECREENVRLRDLLRPAWLQWHAQMFKDNLVDDAVKDVLFTVGALRAIAKVFVEEKKDAW